MGFLSSVLTEAAELPLWGSQDPREDSHYSAYPTDAAILGSSGLTDSVIYLLDNGS